MSEAREVELTMKYDSYHYHMAALLVLKLSLYLSIQLVLLAESSSTLVYIIAVSKVILLCFIPSYCHK